MPGDTFILDNHLKVKDSDEEVLLASGPASQDDAGKESSQTQTPCTALSPCPHWP